MSTHPSTVNWPTKPGFYIVEWRARGPSNPLVRDVYEVFLDTFADSTPILLVRSTGSECVEPLQRAFTFASDRAFDGLRFIPIDLDQIVWDHDAALDTTPSP